MTVTSDGDLEREAIIDAAARCFSRWGVRRTRMEDIAREVGIARPNLYRSVPSKNALIIEVVARQSGRNTERLVQELDMSGPAIDVFTTAFLLAIRNFADSEITRSLLDPSMLHETALISCSPRVLESYAAYWQPIFAHARSQGQLRSDFDFDSTLRWLQFVHFNFLAFPDITADHLERYIRSYVAPSVLRTEVFETDPVANLAVHRHGT